MKRSFLKHIVCPNCYKRLKLYKTKVKKNNILFGYLYCINSSCKKKYLIKNGLIDFSINNYIDRKAISDSFGFEWNSHRSNKIEKSTLFGRNEKEEIDYFLDATGLSVNDLRNKIILDAGCGSARLTKLIAQRSAETLIYGNDIHNAVKDAYDTCKGLPNCEIIKADIFSLPFKKNSFDIVWCNGVIHHSPDPYLAFQKLASLVKPKGIIYLWVYERKFSPYKFVKDIFRFTRLDTLPARCLYAMCKSFAAISVITHFFYRICSFPLSLLFHNSFYIIKTLRKRSYQEFVMTWFDALSPKYDYRYTCKEIENWFTSCDFVQLKFYKNPVGICGIKNRE